PRPLLLPLFPYTTLSRSDPVEVRRLRRIEPHLRHVRREIRGRVDDGLEQRHRPQAVGAARARDPTRHAVGADHAARSHPLATITDRKSTRLNSSHQIISY